MKCAVAGTGYVGLVTGVCLAEKGHIVTCVDIDSQKIKMMQKGKSPIFEKDLETLMCKNSERIAYTVDYKKAYQDADVIFIGVGTPEQEDGSANLSYVHTVSKQIAESITRDCVVVVKSTVPVGTNDKVEQYFKENLKNKVKVYVVSNPEFLSQGTAVNDTLFAKRIIIGSENNTAIEIMKEIYQPFNIPMVIVDRRTAEMIKYACNDFLALKISYMNDIANICDLVGADVEGVKRGMSFDPRIGDKFLNAGIGFGGACFPKDTNALYHFVKNNYGYEAKTIKATIEVNTYQKTLLFFRAQKLLGSLFGKNIGILGLTFKPGTDDLREAPSLDIIRLLAKDGANIFCYDPVGMPNAKKWITEEVFFCPTLKEVMDKSDIIFILTEWPEIVSIDENLLREKYVFDGRNCLTKEKIIHAKYYTSIGRLLGKK